MSGFPPPNRPILAIDVDGVISLFGFEEPPERAPCQFHLIDGMAHCISTQAGELLRRLAPYFEMVWATGWEDRANESLRYLLGIERLPVIRFGRDARFGSAHWKLGPIAAYATGRRLAWIDDSFDDECRAWAAARVEPTLLIQTDSASGLEEHHIPQLLNWAGGHGGRSA